MVSPVQDSDLPPLPAYTVPVRETDWDATRRRFLDAIEPSQRAQADALLGPHGGSPGMRTWLRSIASGAAALPEAIPPEVIEVYREHSSAMPLHGCAACGLRVPIIPGREYGFEGEPVRVFFPECPRCGGRTGWYLLLAPRATSQP